MVHPIPFAWLLVFGLIGSGLADDQVDKVNEIYNQVPPLTIGQKITNFFSRIFYNDQDLTTAKPGDSHPITVTKLILFS